MPARYLPAIGFAFRRGGRVNPVNRACPVKSVFLFNWGLITQVR